MYRFGWSQMTRWLGIIAGAFLAVCCGRDASYAQNQRAACEANRAGVPASRLSSLGRGFNLSGWFEGDNSPEPDFAVLTRLNRAGMTHIRLPVRGDLVIPELTSADATDEVLNRLDGALSRLNSAGFTVSVDLHFGGEFSKRHKDDPQAAMRLLEEAWTGLARIIAKHPPGGVFAELLNEPEIDPDQWQEVARKLAIFVREKLPQTTLIVGPTFWQRADALPRFEAMDDPNIVYAIHFYDPMVFTHQGHWDANDPLSRIRGLPFPFSSGDAVVGRMQQSLNAGAKTRALRDIDEALSRGGSVSQIADALQPALDWQAQHRRPIIINEFGVFKDAAPAASRQRWLRAVVDVAERNCWGWTHWEYAAGFGLLNADGKPDPQTLRTLLGTAR
jgi:endoglucanase